MLKPSRRKSRRLPWLIFVLGLVAAITLAGTLLARA
jgi:hypothetical protein